MGFRTVFVKNGERLKLKLDNLEVSKEGESFTIHLMDIDTVILEGDKTTITTRIMSKLAKYHIDLVICDNTYLPCGIFLGMGQYHKSAKRAIWQADWEELLKQNAWTSIVSQKIKNQIDVARHLDVDEERLQLMQNFLENIFLGDETNREGHVAKVYFNSLYGQGFTRDDNTLPNHCMDYGYSIVRAQVARSVSALGLLPMLGIFHRNEYNSFNLVDDLMEPFRPIMDYYIISQILRTEVEYLTYETRLKLIDFLNQKIKIKGRKVYINQAIADYVNSFIRAMEQNDVRQLLSIQFTDYLECEESEI